MNMLGTNAGQNKYRITGMSTLEEITDPSDDWYNFEANGGMIFTMTISDQSQFNNLLRACADEIFDLVDMSSY